MIDLYTFTTPNGWKASIALEEMELPYRTHVINIMKGDQFSRDFVAVNPNSKIPAIVDQDGPGGQPLAIFESGAILLYLAGEYSIADMASYPWVQSMAGFHPELVEETPSVRAWIERVGARPAVQRGMAVPKLG